MGHNRAPHPGGSIGHVRHHSSRPLINENRVVRDVIVLGASAGGIEVLIRVLAELPADLPALISIVVHRAPDQSQRLRCSANEPASG